jgi:hypothetical protein
MRKRAMSDHAVNTMATSAAWLGGSQFNICA